MLVADQVMVIYAGAQGHLDDIPVTRVLEFQNAFLKHVTASVPDLRKDLAEKKELTEQIEPRLKAALSDFKAKVWKK